MRLCGELERKNRLHQESHTRNRQKIEELRRCCYKEANKLSQYRLDEFSIVQERDPNTVSHLKDQIGELQERVNFMILTLGAALGYPPRSKSASYHFEFQEKAEPRFWIVA